MADTIYVGTCTFPYSYRKRKKSSPTASIKSQTIRSNRHKEGYQRTFSLDRIILKARKDN